MHAVIACMDDEIWQDEQTSVGFSGGWTDWHQLSGDRDAAVHISLAGHAHGRLHADMVGRG